MKFSYSIFNETYNSPDILSIQVTNNIDTIHIEPVFSLSETGKFSISFEFVKYITTGESDSIIGLTYVIDFPSLSGYEVDYEITLSSDSSISE